MKKPSLLVLLACSLLIVLGPATAMESRDYAIHWDVIASGGGPTSSASYSIQGTIGQPIIGLKASTSHRFCSGYWCGAGAVYRVYLPTLVR